MWAVAVAVATVRAGAAASARCCSPLRAPAQPRTAAPWRRRHTRAARPRRTRAARHAAASGSPRGAAARPVRSPCSSWPTAARAAGGPPQRRPAQKGRAIFSWARWFLAGGGLGVLLSAGRGAIGRVRTDADSLTGENFVSSFSLATPPPWLAPSSRPSGETPTTSVATESMLEERRSHTGGGGGGLVPSRATLAAGGAAPSPLP